MKSDYKLLSEALRRMPVPPPREHFVDEALARATAAYVARAPRPWAAFARWETWIGAAVGAGVAVMATIVVMRPSVPSATSPATSITLAMNESRNIDVLIDSERQLEDATIHVATTGSVELDGFDDNHEVQWQTHLERGRNVLSLPVVARTAGDAQLVAVIEHAGRTQRVAIRMLVKRPPRRGVA